MKQTTQHRAIPNTSNRRMLLVALLAAAATLLWLLAQNPAHADTTGGVTIVVDTSADLNPGSNTQTCTYAQGALFVPAPDGCTLRRALRDAAGRPPGDRPIAITFNLPANDPNANLNVAGTWTLLIDGGFALPPLKTQSILDRTGNVTIDGATQPGGRSTGPKIIIETSDRSLEVESTGNTIRNLAFKGGGVIFLKQGENTVENIWMGLSDDGNSIAFRTPGQPARMAGGGIHISSDDNTVRNNVISGAFSRAVDIDGGRNNLIQGNRIGTRADGTVPTVTASIACERGMTLDPANWYGGWGIATTGSDNQIVDNRIAGLHIVQSANDTPPIAIEIFGNNQEVRDNVIGRDSANKQVGVCGQAIKVAGNGSQIIDNLIAGSRVGFEDAVPTAIFSSDSSPTFNGVTVRGNLVINGPGAIYAFGAGVSQPLRLFKSAQITSILGTAVTGTAGEGSPCPGCIVDIYLDDTDEVAEALEHLGSATANGSGNWSFTLPQALTDSQGLRTISTVQSSGIISGKGAGTSAQNSVLYTPIKPLTGVTITGPTSSLVNNVNGYTISVTPANATLPIDYEIIVTGFNPQTISGSDAIELKGDFAWTVPGAKTFTVRAENAGGAVSRTISITVTQPGGGGGTSNGKVYIPIVNR